MSVTHQSVEHPLLEKMVGRWVLKGSIGRKQTVVHDVEADWVLQHHYVRIHEVSREKDAKGQPEYEALVFVTSNEKGPRYSCVWLDVTGGLSVLSIGTADPKRDEIPFVFKNEKGEVDLTNSFVYNPKDDSWEWRIDNVKHGVPKEFARLRLTHA